MESGFEMCAVSQLLKKNTNQQKEFNRRTRNSLLKEKESWNTKTERNEKNVGKNSSEERFWRCDSIAEML